ncbi:MAG: exopolysaccharide biosynthesis polyprenyl glycosylphosphotransferase [Nibricoccus sp.]
MLRGKKTSLAVLLLDIIALVGTFNAVGVLRGIYQLHGLILSPLLVPCGLLIIALYLIDGYKLRTDMLSLDYASQHIIALIATLIATLLITFVLFPGGYPLQQSRAAIALSFLALAPLTLTYRRFLYGRYIAHRKDQCIVFLGDRGSAQEFTEECAVAGMTQTIYVASTEENPTGTATAAPSLPKLLDELHAKKIVIEAIVVRESNRAVSTDLSQQLIDLYFSGTPTYTLELFHQIYWRKIPLYRLNQTWLFQEGFQIAREPAFERVKRLSDIFLSLFGLLLFSPVFVLAAAAVWAEDRGPVFFKQTRIGKNRVPFKVYKFRSMRENAAGDPYAQEGDKRITRAGRFLRATRIDELPQLLNVFNGEMSLIGPRAEWDKLVHDYERQIPCYHFRHLVRPGITGWAQVNYPYGANIGDTLRKLEYDLYYIRHFSFRLDASIVLKTLHVMLFGKGR